MTATRVLFAERHLAVVEPMFHDEAMQRFSLIPVPAPEGFARTWFDAYEAGRRTNTRELFAWEDEDGTFLGFGACFGPEPGTDQVELGYGVVAAHRGKGIAKQMLRELTSWAEQTHAPQRIVLQIQAVNLASQAVAKSCGYVYEGTQRNVHFKQGLRADNQIWSRIPSDPPLPN
jgi:RimJ/RimL family protein N-acetyltransferase